MKTIKFIIQLLIIFLPFIIFFTSPPERKIFRSFIGMEGKKEFTEAILVEIYSTAEL